MNLAVRDQESAPEPVAGPPQIKRQASKLLPQLFERLDKQRKLTVLDVGRALPETVDFFSGFNCRIHVLDLYAELQSGRIERGSTSRTLQRQFQDLFAFPPGTELDICLLWDLPHYLDEKLLRSFSRALWPWLVPGSRAHVFGVHSAATQLLNREYGIFDRQTLSIRHRVSEQMKNSPHPQSFMSEWLTCFATASGVLLPDGKIETLMRSTV